MIRIVLNSYIPSMKSSDFEFGTPSELIKDIHDAGIHIALDACACYKNSIALRWFSLHMDALQQNWITPMGTYTWMNPPYGKTIPACPTNCTNPVCTWRGCHVERSMPGKDHFIQKAAIEAACGNTTVLALLPVATSSRAFHQFIYQNFLAEVLFFTRRLKFIGGKSSSRNDSMLVIFGRDRDDLLYCKSKLINYNWFFR